MNAVESAKAARLRYSERKQRIVEVVKSVAKRLGNTPAICRKCYVHPLIIATYIETGELQTARTVKQRQGFAPEELFLLALLEERGTATKNKAA